MDGYLGSEGGVSTAESNLQNCATDSSHYYVATSTASINSAFVSIANQISALRLTQ